MATSFPPPTYYDILGIPRNNADPLAIRKAYLRASLRCHPDKNPGREEQAKAEFIKVGQAYAVLSDAGQRAAYDCELDRSSTRRSSSYSSDGRPTTSTRTRPPPQQQQQPHQQKQPQQPPFSGGTKHANATNQDEFDTFMRMFDETVSGMSEEELNMAIGAAAVVGSIVGSILGARAIHNKVPWPAMLRVGLYKRSMRIVSSACWNGENGRRQLPGGRRYRDRHRKRVENEYFRMQAEHFRKWQVRPWVVVVRLHQQITPGSFRQHTTTTTSMQGQMLVLDDKDNSRGGRPQRWSKWQWISAPICNRIIVEMVQGEV